MIAAGRFGRRFADDYFAVVVRPAPTIFRRDTVPVDEARAANYMGTVLVELGQGVTIV